jgi:hypothetical protein
MVDAGLPCPTRDRQLVVDSRGSFFRITPPMRCLNVVCMVVPPGPSHSFRIPVVRHDIVVIRELFVTDSAFPVLFDDLAVQQFCAFPPVSGVRDILSDDAGLLPGERQGVP